MILRDLFLHCIHSHKLSDENVFFCSSQRLVGTKKTFWKKNVLVKFVFESIWSSSVFPRFCKRIVCAVLSFIFCGFLFWGADLGWEAGVRSPGTLPRCAWWSSQQVRSQHLFFIGFVFSSLSLSLSVSLSHPYLSF